MSKKDMILQKIAFFKMLFFADLAIAVSLIAFVATHPENGALITAITVGSLILAIYGMLELWKVIFNYIKNLEDI